jgi:hypothetical protein
MGSNLFSRVRPYEEKRCLSRGTWAAGLGFTEQQGTSMLWSESNSRARGATWKLSRLSELEPSASITHLSTHELSRSLTSSSSSKSSIDTVLILGEGRSVSVALALGRRAVAGKWHPTIRAPPSTRSNGSGGQLGRVLCSGTGRSAELEDERRERAQPERLGWFTFSVGGGGNLEVVIVAAVVVLTATGGAVLRSLVFQIVAPALPRGFGRLPSTGGAGTGGISVSLRPQPRMPANPLRRWVLSFRIVESASALPFPPRKNELGILRSELLNVPGRGSAERRPGPRGEWCCRGRVMMGRWS